MRLLLQSLLIATATASSQLREGAQTKKSPKDVEQQLLQRELSVEHHSGFAPLSCNDNITPCVTWSSKAFDPAAGTVVISCGECVTMDLSGESLELPYGLGKQFFLYIANTPVHVCYIYIIIYIIYELVHLYSQHYICTSLGTPDRYPRQVSFSRWISNHHLYTLYIRTGRT